jgi:hypothetical protein
MVNTQIGNPRQNTCDFQIDSIIAVKLILAALFSKFHNVPRKKLL